VRPTLESIEKADPIADVKKAIEKKDFRFAAVRGYSLVVPGIETASITDDKVWVIEGTSDTGDSRLNRVAHEYAHRYNGELRSLLPNQSLQPTPRANEK
jgi:hypothetical protein